MTTSTPIKPEGLAHRLPLFPAPLRRPTPDAAGSGFYESSFDLRRGLEVSEAPLTALPEDLKRAFQQAGARA